LHGCEIFEFNNISISTAKIQRIFEWSKVFKVAKYKKSLGFPKPFAPFHVPFLLGSTSADITVIPC